MRIALQDVGLTSEQQSYVVSVLIAWGEWSSNRSDYNELSRATRQITCSPTYRLQTNSVEQMADAERVGYKIPYNDNCIKYANGIIKGMPSKIYEVLVARYRWSEHTGTADKIGFLKIPKQTYYDRLRSGHERFYKLMNWKLIN